MFINKFELHKIGQKTLEDDEYRRPERGGGSCGGDTPGEK